MSVRKSVLAVCATAFMLGGCAHLTAPIADNATVDVEVADADAGAEESYENMPPVVVEATHSGTFSAPAAENAVVTVAAGNPQEPYLLDTGDRLRIFVYGQPNLSRLYTVDQSGRVSVPLIGNVTARGKTTTDLEAVIRGRLGAEFVKDPEVTVDVQQNRPFFILGEVRNAGQYPYVSGMTVQTAVAVAGGYSERASERAVKITRRVNGFVEEFEATSNFELIPGDTVYVVERFF